MPKGAFKRRGRAGSRKMTTIGVISDTHGLLRREAIAALEGSDEIVHAGDIGDARILDRLRDIAPVAAVRGNVDRGAWAGKLPETEFLEVDGVSVYVLHILAKLDLEPEAAGIRAVIYGHSHMPRQEAKDGVLYFNPGSAGPKRFHLPVTVGRLIVEQGELRGEIVELVR
jgi:putative phosphoesterase